MDATFALAGLVEEFSQLLEDGDFAGGEELLTGALGSCRQGARAGAGGPSLEEAFLHLQFGKLYGQWNKLSSSLNHLTLAAEIAHSRADSFLLLQIQTELRQVRHRQKDQKP